jgi:formylglycine-generating enzyme required for sulfatase activity
MRIRDGVRNQKYPLFLCLCILPVLLFTACSAPPASEQPAAPVVPNPTPLPTKTEVPPTPTREATQAPTALPEPSATPLPTETEVPPTPTAVPVEPTQAMFRVSEIDQMEQVYVEAGEFTMGTDDKDAKIFIEGMPAYPEIPMHTVYLDGYWIDKYELTNGKYALCVDAGVCQPPKYTWSYTRDEYYGNPEFSNYPVINVDWFMATAYCEWAGRRLPSEAEWEKAARGTDARKYPWGNEPITSERVNLCDINCPRPHANANFDDKYPETAPVGSFPAGASPYGVMDMAGNVWEWTNTLIRPYPYDATDGREDPDVEGPEISGQRVWRGGTWANGIWWVRASLRYRSVPWYSISNLGFRCAASE